MRKIRVSQKLNRVLVEIVGVLILSSRFDESSSHEYTHTWLLEAIYLSFRIGERQIQVCARGAEKERHRHIGNRIQERGMIWRRKNNSDDSECEKKRKRKRERDREGGGGGEARRRSGLTGRQLLSPTWNIVFHARHSAYARITTRRLMFASPTAWPSINSGVDAHEISGWYHRYRRIEAGRTTRRGKEGKAAKTRNRGLRFRNR